MFILFEERATFMKSRHDLEGFDRVRGDTWFSDLEPKHRKLIFLAKDHLHQS